MKPFELIQVSKKKHLLECSGITVAEITEKSGRFYIKGRGLISGFNYDDSSLENAKDTATAWTTGAIKGYLSVFRKMGAI